MTSKGMKIYDMITVLIAVLVTISSFLAPPSQPLVFEKKSIVEEDWAVKDLTILATDRKVAAAVSHLMGDKHEPGAPIAVQVQRIQHVIDAATEEEMRTALLIEVDGKPSRKKDPLGAFARTVDAAATCRTSGTVGGDGVDLCVERCESTAHTTFKITRRGGCYLLCSVAVAPCTKGLVSWEEFSNNWVAPSARWVTSAKQQATVQVKIVSILARIAWMEVARDMADYSTTVKNWVAAQVGAMATLAHAKGMERARHVTASPTLAGLSFWVFAALDVLQTSTALQVTLLLLSALAFGRYILKLRKQLKAAREEASRIKMNQLFKIRGRLLKQEGFYAMHDYGAWAIYHASVKANKAERKKESCRLLGGIVSGRTERATATRFARWKAAAATVDAASSEAGAKDEEDKVAG